MTNEQYMILGYAIALGLPLVYAVGLCLGARRVGRLERNRSQR